MAERPAGVPTLAQLRWPALDTPTADRPLLLVPVGSMEQHGPALPLGTDTMVAGAVVHEAARRLRSRRPVVVAPALAYGASGEHQDFPGTVSIGHEALHLLLLELVRSACTWAEGVILVNGHGGNAVTVRDAVRRARDEGHAVAWTDCRVAGADAHAGHTETSLLLFLTPWWVRPDLLEAGPTEPIDELLPALRAGGVRPLSPNGVLGDPTSATAEEGRRLLGEMVGRVVRELSDIDVDDDGRLVDPAPAATRA